MTIDVFPCLRVCECELVGHGPQDGAIFEVKLVDIKRPPAPEEAPDAVYLLQEEESGSCKKS